MASDISNKIFNKIRRTGKEGLITLDLSRQGMDDYLTEIPKEVFRIEELEVLRFRNHRLDQVPAGIWKLKNLKKLDLSINRIKSVPGWIEKLVNLTHLDLRQNSLNSFPAQLFGLPLLLHLDLIGNRVKEVPEDIYHLPNLNTFRVSRVFRISPSIVELRQLKELFLMSSQIEQSLDHLSYLEGLEVLGLPANELSYLPDSLQRLQNLKRLSLSNNEFDSLPKFISLLGGLEQLELKKNPLHTLPPNFKDLKNLKILELGDCEFEQIPEVVYEMATLEKISFANKTIKARYGSTYSHNQIREISPKVLQMRNLKKLDLADNPVDNPPPEIVRKGVDPIKNYFRQLEAQGEETLYEAKLLIVGEGGAGKTTLANKVIDMDYRLQPEDSTKGIEVSKWEFPIEGGKTFRVNIWDFGGQEIYHQTHQFFLTKRSLYILVADNRREDTDFYYWLSVVELLSENSPVIIVKNEKQDRRRDIGEKLLRGEFANLRETLATNLADNRGLSEIVNKIKHYVGSLPHIGTTLPSTWVKVREALERNISNHISLDQYFALCSSYGFSSKEDKLQLSGYLHDLGVILHFQKDALLKKTIILKPKWGTDAVYKVLDNEKVITNLGKFSQKDLEEIWFDDKHAEMQDELLQLMINFKLCYKIPNSEDYIAPQLLSENPPEYDWNEEENLILRYTYEFMPKGITNQFVVALHKLIAEQKYVWRSGVLLEKEQTRAEVIEHYGRREIKIRCHGSNKRDLMTVATHELDKIHDSYNRLRFSKLIPCNCADCKGNQNPYFYEYEDLRRFIADRQEQIQCRNSYKMVSVRELVEDIKGKQHKDMTNNKRDQIFISYSRRDKEWLDKLKVMLKPLVRGDKISVWDDTQIRTGAKWRDEITKALESTKVAVLLVSPNFLASDFIAEHKLAPLLEAAEREGVTIFWIAVSHSLFSETEINDYNCANNPDQPLDGLSSAELNQVLVSISKDLNRAFLK